MSDLLVISHDAQSRRAVRKEIRHTSLTYVFGRKQSATGVLISAILCCISYGIQCRIGARLLRE